MCSNYILFDYLVLQTVTRNWLSDCSCDFRDKVLNVVCWKSLVVVCTISCLNDKHCSIIVCFEVQKIKLKILFSYLLCFNVKHSIYLNIILNRDFNMFIYSGWSINTWHLFWQLVLGWCYVDRVHYCSI